MSHVKTSWYELIYRSLLPKTALLFHTAFSLNDIESDVIVHATSGDDLNNTTISYT